ncbi:MAG: MBL fold metallo-hydrolase [Cyclobacteriaceae bacterium]
MIVTVLGSGTSQGVPVIACDCEVCKSIDYRDQRGRASIHVQQNDTSIVVDTGADFRQQMLRERITKVDAILYTHEHKDHTAGMDDVRSFNFKHKMDMPVFARKRVIDQLKNEFSYVFAEHKYPGVPSVEINEMNGEPFTFKGIDITPIEVLHYKLPVFGFRIGGFSYITDANHIAPDEIAKIKGSKVLILNALQKEDHISHFTLSQAIELAEEVNAEKTFFTHISHKLGTHRDVELELPEGMFLAWDGLKITL